MNHQKFLYRIAFLFAFFLLKGAVSQGQVQTARFNTVINPMVKGFYEYLPEGYNSNSDSYPLIIFFHGAGERGDGSASQLPKVLANGIPKLINNGTFPKSFTVNGQTHRFIIISPQLVDVCSQAQVNDIINYAISHYRVDPSRIYLTGLSMGGGMCFLYLGQNSTYANRIAAMVPVCEAYGYDLNIAKNIANANIAVWATHNNADPTVSVTKTIQYTDAINSFSPANRAKRTIFQASSHDAWSKTYDPNFREDGLNVYEWLLQYKKGGSVPVPNKVPTANAGADQTITLPANSVSLNGSGSDPDGTINSYNWSKVSGPSQGTILNAATGQTMVNNLASGTYVFRLTVKDNAGASAYDDVTIKVNPAVSTMPPASTGQRILIDFGTTSTGVDQWGKYWNNVANVQPGTPLTNAKTITNAATAIGLQIINRIDGSFNTSGSGTNTGNSTGAVGDYPQTATTDFAFAHYTTTTGKWRIFGLDPQTQYRIKFWGNKSHSNTYTVQIKRSDESNWQEYNASFNANFDNAAIFTITGKTEVSFDIRTKEGTAGFGYINVIDIQSNVGTSSPINKAPVVNAGADKSINLPANSVTLAGTASDADGRITAYSWAKLSGPAPGVIASPSQPQTNVSGLVEGNYLFEFKATDDLGAISKDTVAVKVNGAVNSAKYIRVNLYGGTNSYSNSQWNNWNVGSKEASNISSGTLKYSDGVASSITAVLSYMQGTADNGSNYGSGMAPAEVLRYASYSTVSRTLTINGLSTSKKYDIEFYASRNTSGNSSTYTINGVNKTVNSYNNLSNKVVFTGISPNSKGQIVVGLSRNGTYGYINGFTLIENAASDITMMAAKRSVETEAAIVAVYPNPFKDRFELQITGSQAGKLQVQVSDLNGVVRKVFNLTKTEGPVQLYLSAGELPAGNYMISVKIGDEAIGTVKVSKL